LRAHTLTVALAVVVACVLSTATVWADSVSVYDWWTTDGLLYSTTTNSWYQGKNWDDKYGTSTSDAWRDFSQDTDGSPAHSHYQNGIWNNGDAFSELELELTSSNQLSSQSFGWFGWDSSGSGSAIDDGTGEGYQGNVSLSLDIDGDGTSETDTFGLYQVFSGSDGMGTTWQSPTNSFGALLPDYWGFWYKNTTKDYDPGTSGSQRTVYSRWQLNPDNTSWNFHDHRAEVFEHPRWNTGYGWVICWEGGTDWAKGNHDHTYFDQHDPLGDVAGSYPTYEPDYNDMVITFRRATYGSDGPYTPGDNSPEPGTWILLLATGAVGGLLRRRRKDD